MFTLPRKREILLLRRNVKTTCSCYEINPYASQRIYAFLRNSIKNGFGEIFCWRKMWNNAYALWNFLLTQKVKWNSPLTRAAHFTAKQFHNNRRLLFHSPQGEFHWKNPKSIWLGIFSGWAGGIRTHEVTESKSVALPLGDSPIFDTIRVYHIPGG